MKRSTSSLALGLLSSSALTTALRCSIRGRATHHGGQISGLSNTPQKSSSLLSVGTGAGNESNIINSNNMFYSTNITIAGVGTYMSEQAKSAFTDISAVLEIPVQLDTGSTDLWIDPQGHPGAFTAVQNFTDVPVTLRYEKGSVEGSVARANMSFADFNVENQAFVSATNAVNLDMLFEMGVWGMMGLGFDALSDVDNAVDAYKNETWGRSLLSNLFLQEPETPNHIAFALERAGDLDDTAQGSFDVGEIQPQYEAVEDSNLIPLWPETAEQWTVLVDSITVAGSNIPLNSTVKGDVGTTPPAGKSVALLDTGSSFAEIPRWAVDAIYGSISGSAYHAQDDLWLVPCMGEVKVSMVIGNITIHIHPFDLTIPTVHDNSDGTQKTYCRNTLVSASNSPNTFDFRLGTTFLRNVYSVYDFGDFDDDGNMGKPYVRLLPLTDPTTAGASFQKNRAAALSQLPPEGSIQALVSVTAPNTLTDSGLSGSSGSGSGSGTNGVNNLASASLSDTDDASVNETLDKLLKYAPVALALLGLNVVLLFGAIALGAYAIFRKPNKAKSPSTGPNARGVYAPVRKLHDDDARSHASTGQYDIPQSA
ncbi:hypothetical protein FRC12_018074 [Ceratobasidium sp. 428]|nr:hypothetical protein FRC12_018074 [Ceratobasidium sp. 428]